MGRKNRNNIKRNIDTEKELLKKEDKEIMELAHKEDIHEIQQKHIDKQFDIIWNIRREMLDYCDNNSIPLCDYLTPNIVEQFVEYISE
jgi:hypothetical protein